MGGRWWRQISAHGEILMLKNRIIINYTAFRYVNCVALAIFLSRFFFIVLQRLVNCTA